MSKKQRIKNQKMGFNATWSMAVGGMVGGGIFATLGLVIELAGAYAWLAYLVGGIAALITGVSYQSLARRFEEGGGVYTFLREVKQKTLAVDMAWLLMVSYILTISVYAFTFGHYMEYLLGFGQGIIARIAAAVIIISLTAINLRGVSSAAWVEIVAVWFKCLILAGLSLIGLWHFNPDVLAYTEVQYAPIFGVGIGAAVVFMAYEGFQLLAYDYEDINEPKRTLPLAITTAIVFVIVLYIIITLGTAALVGTEVIVQDKEIALAKAGQAAMGVAGMIIVSLAAVMSTASAINSTLFATARLAKHVAEKKDMPAFFAKENKHNVPNHSLVLLGGIALFFAIIGDLGQLVEGASLLFLIIFTIVNTIAARHTDHYRTLKWAGAVLCGSLAACGAYYLAVNHIWVFAAIIAIAIAVFIRNKK
ncbi:MAG: amino acid permease [Micavibrio sp.]|mgnify:CR=1 FL=1|nr:amino acid permease [Micavibrio sp.]